MSFMVTSILVCFCTFLLKNPRTFETQMEKHAKTMKKTTKCFKTHYQHTFACSCFNLFVLLFDNNIRENAQNKIPVAGTEPLTIFFTLYSEVNLLPAALPTIHPKLRKLCSPLSCLLSSNQCKKCVVRKRVAVALPRPLCKFEEWLHRFEDMAVLMTYSSTHLAGLS